MGVLQFFFSQFTCKSHYRKHNITLFGRCTFDCGKITIQFGFKIKKLKFKNEQFDDNGNI